MVLPCGPIHAQPPLHSRASASTRVANERGWPMSTVGHSCCPVVWCLFEDPLRWVLACDAEVFLQPGPFHVSLRVPFTVSHDSRYFLTMGHFSFMIKWATRCPSEGFSLTILTSPQMAALHLQFASTHTKFTL